MSSVKQALEKLGSGWKYDSKTRGATNLETGEKISRRQLDKNYGLLSSQGFTSYEQKAKSRPAPVKGTPEYTKKLAQEAKRREKKRLRDIPVEKVNVHGVKSITIEATSRRDALKKMKQMVDKHGKNISHIQLAFQYDRQKANEAKYQSDKNDEEGEWKSLSGHPSIYFKKGVLEKAEKSMNRKGIYPKKRAKYMVRVFLEE